MLNKCIEAVDLILDSIYSNGSNDQLLSDFFIKDPNDPTSLGLIGTTIYLRDIQDYLKAVIFIKRFGARYLSELSLAETRSKVTNFLTDNFWYIRHGELTRNPDISYKHQIAIAHKEELAKALLNSTLFSVVFTTYFYPFQFIYTQLNFRSEIFFILNSKNISKNDVDLLNEYSDLFNFSYYPSLIKDNYGARKVETWIGVKAPTQENSRKKLSTILGALALFEDSQKRYCFIATEADNGCSFFSEDCSYSISSTSDLIPSLYFKINITDDSFKKLEILSKILTSDDKESLLNCYALTNYYNSWFENDGDRYRSLCTALESLILDTKTQSSLKFKNLSKQYTSRFSEEQLKDLLKIRGSIVHGKSPHLSSSDDYNNYLVKYLSEPLNDLIEITDSVLRSHIF